MNLLPKKAEEFGDVTYWDQFFKKRGEKKFEWYGEYPNLCTYLSKYIKLKDDILVPGCGNSSLSNDMYDVGYHNITNIDVSSVVINQMNSSNKQRSRMKFLLMDVMDMKFDNDAFTVVLDKGTLDALMPNDEPETISRVEKYFDEALRVLKVGGRFVCISLLQSHIVKFLLAYFPTRSCMFRVVRCWEAEQAEESENTMPIFMVVCTKFRDLKMTILELALSADGKLERTADSDNIIAGVGESQQMAFICNGIRKGSLVEEENVAIDLALPGDTSSRYTIYVIDIPANPKFNAYSAFVVPQGRQAEWMFSTNDGRRKLANLSKSNRLAVILLNRDHKYTDLQSIQDETAEYVKNLAPSNFSNKILFLSVGNEIEAREVQYAGTSEFSGDYIIEDVVIYDDYKYRRLYFKNTQSLIQSEAKLKTVKAKNGKPRTTVDLTYLTCKHHIYMTIACHVTTTLNRNSDCNPRVLLIGLGGGSLCMFMRKFLPKTHITVVDIDPHMLQVATDWFSLKQDQYLKVVIMDGLEFLKQSFKNEDKYDAIMFDVDNKDISLGMSCPPQRFLDADIMQYVSTSLNKDGLFILNMVLRNEKLRPQILQHLGDYYKSIVTYKMSSDLNEMVCCRKQSHDTPHLKRELVSSAKEFRKQLKMNGYPIDEIQEVDDFVTEMCKVEIDSRKMRR